MSLSTYTISMCDKCEAEAPEGELNTAECVNCGDESCAGCNCETCSVCCDTLCDDCCDDNECECGNYVCNSCWNSEHDVCQQCADEKLARRKKVRTV